MKQLPELEPNRKLAIPKTVDRTLTTGLRVIAIRRPAVPLVELRLRIPFAKANLARGDVLSQALFSGTASRSSVDIAAELQSIGGGLGASTDSDRLIISGDSLASGLPNLLDILADVLQSATYPDDEVATERERFADRIQIARTQPAHLVRVALLKRVYGSHPYAIQTPTVDAVKSVRPAALRSLHLERVHPTGAIMVLVGDINPEKAIDQVATALAGWTGDGKDVSLAEAPAPRPGPVELVDRPGSVQSSIRLALPAVGRTHADFPALQLANLILGGYFSSRWTENIREDKGYTYSPHSALEHSIAGSILVMQTDVATEVTAPALLETWYELGRMATLAPKAEELEQARQYAIGTLLLGTSTQAGIASLAAMYAAYGLELSHLATYSRQLSAVTVDDVARVSAEYLAPDRSATVILGDAARVEPSLRTLGPVDRTSIG
ncbi:MAG TPA: pitrilysin family protein [Micromonosporaceae bacterium]